MIIDCALAHAKEQLDKPSFNSERVSKALRHNCIYTTVGGYAANRNYSPTGNPTKSYVDFKEDDLAEALEFPTGFPRVLFNDGNPPWSSRENLKVYIQTLEELKEALHG